MVPGATTQRVRDSLNTFRCLLPEEDDEALREERIATWRDRVPRKGSAFPGDPRRWEIERGTTAELTPLGEKLLGLKAW